MAVSAKPKPERDPDEVLISDAPPTSPAGMKRQDIRVELAEKHGINMATTRDVSLRGLTETLVQSRLDREDEVRRGVAPVTERVKTKTPAKPTPVTASKTETALAAIEAEADDDFSDLDFDDTDEVYVGTDENGADVYEPASDESCMCGTPESEHNSVDPPHMFTPQGRGDYTSPTGQTARIVRASTVFDGDHGETVDLTDYAAANPDVAAWFDDESEHDDDPEALFSDEAIAAREANKPAPIFVGMPDTFDYIYDGHYGASPSGAERWTHCTASLQASREFLETLTDNQQRALATGGQAARQGTTAHTVGAAELMLMLGTITQNEYDHIVLDATINPVLEESYDEEMAEHLTEYVDYVRQLHDAGRPLMIEERVSAKVWLTGNHDGEMSEREGSADCVALPHPDPTHAEHKKITVTDLKYGNGIDVSVDANPQVRIYGLGALAKFLDAGGDLDQIETMEYVIVQPRLGGIKVWEESLDDLLDWRDTILAPRLTAALYGVSEGAVFAPSEDACQWCHARGGCPALIEDRMAAGAEMFDAVVEAEVSGNPINPGSLDNDTLGRYLAQAQEVIDLVPAMKEEVQRRLHRGQHVSRFELVNYTPPRTYAPDAQAKIDAAIKDGTIPSIYKPPSLMTPTQALTLLKEQVEAREWLEDVIDVHDVVPVVGPDPERRALRKDHRKSWNGRAPESMFDDETDLHESPATAIEEMFPDA